MANSSMHECSQMWQRSIDWPGGGLYKHSFSQSGGDREKEGEKLREG